MTVNGPAARLFEQREHALQIGHREEEHVDLLGQPRELQRRLGDDPENALAADEELPQVDAGVVLLERAVELEHLAGRR
jgi:hypothetical protein